MKLTDFLISRQHGLSINISVYNNSILFKDINAVLELQNWEFVNLKKFTDFISEYEFPKNDEFVKKDRDILKQNIPKPQVMIQKKGNAHSENNPLITIYLYKKSQLTGDSLLHVRSVNKIEQMWVPYFINLISPQRTNPKVYKKDFYEYCQSGDIIFKYNRIGDLFINDARLRILTFAFNQHILLMYVFDQNDNELKQEDLNEFATTFKSSN